MTESFVWSLWALSILNWILVWGNLFRILEHYCLNLVIRSGTALHQEILLTLDFCYWLFCPNILMWLHLNAVLSFSFFSWSLCYRSWIILQRYFGNVLYYLKNSLNSLSRHCALNWVFFSCFSSICKCFKYMLTNVFAAHVKWKKKRHINVWEYRI